MLCVSRGAVAALERASQNGGILLNEKEKLAPHFYNKKLTISPVNALVMAMHSDQGEFQTNAYTQYNETQNRNEAVKKGQKGRLSLNPSFLWNYFFCHNIISVNGEKYIVELLAYSTNLLTFLILLVLLRNIPNFSLIGFRK